MRLISNVKKLLEDSERLGELDYQKLMYEQDRRAAFGDLDPAFKPIYELCRGCSMTSVERLFDLYKSVEYVVKAGIHGAIVECGVWRGGSMMLVARTLRMLGDSDRLLALFDTFEGHPKPADSDANADIFGTRASQITPGLAKVSLEEVCANIGTTGYFMGNTLYVKGLVEETLPAFKANNPDLKVAIARLDTDWYEPAKVEMEVLWPMISPGGILIIDDYGHFKGQRQAVDEYFADKPVKLTRVDYSCRVAQKVAP